MDEQDEPVSLEADFRVSKRAWAVAWAAEGYWHPLVRVAAHPGGPGVSFIAFLKDDPSQVASASLDIRPFIECDFIGLARLGIEQAAALCRALTRTAVPARG